MKRLDEYEVYVGKNGVAYDDEGNAFSSGGRAQGTYGLRDFGPPRSHGNASARIPGYSEKLAALNKALKAVPGNRFLADIRRQLERGKRLSPKQLQVVRDILGKIRMKDDAEFFMESEMSESMRKRIEGLEKFTVNEQGELPELSDKNLETLARGAKLLSRIADDARDNFESLNNKKGVLEGIGNISEAMLQLDFIFSVLGMRVNSEFEDVVKDVRSARLSAERIFREMKKDPKWQS